MAAGEHKAKVLNCRSVDEGRRRVLLIAAAILAARKLATWDGKPSPVLESAISDSIALADSAGFERTVEQRNRQS
jgi:hypothetical protein